MAQRGEIDLNSEDGRFAFRQWGMSIFLSIAKQSNQTNAVPHGLAQRKRTPYGSPSTVRRKLARAYAETTLASCGSALRDQSDI
jgi:hypothetical protein